MGIVYNKGGGNMYKAIVVDDEKWIVEGIKAGVNWGKYGFEVIGQADNGLDALQLIKTLHPDLVLTDIKMPEMNGLELIKNGRVASPETLFVVLSGHAEFAYAQRALNYGTFGYCLKPFEIEEIHSMLARVAESLEEKLKASSPSFSVDMYEAICSGNTVRMNQLLVDYEMPLHHKSQITPIVVQGADLVSASQDVKQLSFFMNHRRQGYLVRNEHKEAFLHKWSLAHPSGSFSTGVGYPISDVAELEASLEAASLAAYGIFTTGKTGIYRATHQTSGPINETIKQINYALDHKDRIQFVEILESSRDLFHNLTFTIKDAYLIYTAAMYLFFREGNQMNSRFFEGYEQMYTHYGNVDVMIDEMIKETHGHFTEEVSAYVVKVAHKKVKEIVFHLHENFTQEITIQGLASKFYLSPNYLCQLFKKEVGETIVEYVSRLRIEYACKLLKETDYTIQQVGEKCGFQDYFYFTRIFKRYNKITPTQYRVTK
ncbi:response regulator [Paenibacillus anaericanus]|uniref:Response regulator n=2 Tax=Paenibacillus anaericanus TaxID=170367 RepID=A0A433XX48_9BACL|nr:response regulator [Paenibacillus anaericanus]